jgi:hypothetical protein
MVEIKKKNQPVTLTTTTRPGIIRLSHCKKGFLSLPTPKTPSPNFTTRRLVFHASNTASLEAKIIMHWPLHLSRVGVVLTHF